MRIAILDNINEDIGLKILFPEADYYVCEEKSYRSESYNHYKFMPILQTINITDKNYDFLFIIMPLRHLANNEPAVENIRKNYYNIIKKIIDENNFKKVCFFDNEDYDCDPVNYIPNPTNNVIFFKRNYNKTKIYYSNVIPFPYITFGTKNIIEKIDRDIVSKTEYFKTKPNRVFFTGGLYIHECIPFGVYVNRIDIYNKISSTLFNPGHMDNNTFMTTLKNSKYGVDLQGAGNPNTRTFEIMISGALLLQQKNNLKWTFEDEISEYCLFIDANDYFKKLKLLQENDELYNDCLKIQYDIVNKYFNKEYLREYIIINLQELI